MKSLILITFINDSYFGFPIENCFEVQISMEIQKLPFLKKYFLGLGNFRGEVIMLLDLMQLINGKETRKGKENSFLRIKHGQNEVAILVNEIIDVIEIPEIERKDAKNFLDPGEAEFISDIVDNSMGPIRIVETEKLVNL